MTMEEIGYKMNYVSYRVRRYPLEGIDVTTEVTKIMTRPKFCHAEIEANYSVLKSVGQGTKFHREKLGRRSTERCP